MFWMNRISGPASGKEPVRSEQKDPGPTCGIKDPDSRSVACSLFPEHMAYGLFYHILDGRLCRDIHASGIEHNGLPGSLHAIPFPDLHSGPQKVLEDGCKVFKRKCGNRHGKFLGIHTSDNLSERIVRNEREGMETFRPFLEKYIRVEPGIRACPCQTSVNTVTIGKKGKCSGLCEPGFLPRFEENYLKNR